MLKAAFNIYGLPLEVTSDHPLLFDMIRQELRTFRTGKRDPAGHRGQVRLQLAALPLELDEAAIPAPYSKYHQEWRLEPPKAARQQVTLYGRSAVVVVEQPRKRLIQAGVIPQPWVVPDPAWHYCFTHPVSFWLKQRNLFFVHAACLADQGRGMLIIGPSHAGKTTFSLLGVQSGLHFLSDEQPLLSFERSEIRALAFPRRIRADRALARRFPELKAVPTADCPRPPIPLETIWPRRMASSCSVNILIFPSYRAEGKATTRRMRPTEVLAELMQDDYFIWYRNKPFNRISKKHLDLFEKLASNIPAFRVTYSHRSLRTIPALLKKLLDYPK